VIECRSEWMDSLEANVSRKVFVIAMANELPRIGRTINTKVLADTAATAHEARLIVQIDVDQQGRQNRRSLKEHP